MSPAQRQRLRVYQLLVAAALGHQLLVGAQLHDAARIQHRDLVRGLRPASPEALALGLETVSGDVRLRTIQGWLHEHLGAHGCEVLFAE